ncbi:MAG: hypothetical protein Q7R33_05015 [Nitrosarchaeum sp.]|nr:hypothetical protein [Nitrosarchaeum sp.]
MKLLFATLLSHNTVEIFKFNWFASRLHLDHGFEIPHILLNDGTLTVDDITDLNSLLNVVVHPEPIHLYDVPKAVYLAKLQCFDVGFEKYQADRVVIIDTDVFFYKPWDADLQKICRSPAICLRDWGSSLGPNIEQYKQLYGVTEDAMTPNCNTGLYSIPVEQHYKIKRAMKKHFEQPFMIMEDQGIFFAAFYGEIEYINGFKCIVNGAEDYDFIWQWILAQRGSHLMGMRVRPKAYESLTNHTIQSFPEKVHLSQFVPKRKYIHYGLMEYETYDFTKPWAAFPTSSNQVFITDALYVHGGSWIEWQLPRQFQRFETQLVCMDTGISVNCQPVTINGIEYKLNEKIDVELNGQLKIETKYGDGAHYAFLSPRLTINKGGRAPILVSG